MGLQEQGIGEAARGAAVVGGAAGDAGVHGSSTAPAGLGDDGAESGRTVWGDAFQGWGTQSGREEPSKSLRKSWLPRKGGREGPNQAHCQLTLVKNSPCGCPK